jgi:hypothetical protein
LHLDRSATSQQVRDAIEVLREDLRSNYHLYTAEKSEMSLEVLDDVEHALTNPTLRDVYDKSLQLVTKEEYRERGN